MVNTMEKIIPNGEHLPKNKPNNDLIIWKKPSLIQLDIRQTLTGTSGCPDGWLKDETGCYDPNA